MEDDGFVLVSKDLVAEDDDAASISSSRSSLFMVEDPSADEVMLHGEKEEEITPMVKPTAKSTEILIDLTAEASEEDENLSDETQQVEQAEVSDSAQLAISGKIRLVRLNLAANQIIRFTVAVQQNVHRYAWTYFE